MLAVLYRRVKRVGGTHLCVIAPGQHSSFRNVAAMASRWQHCVNDLTRSKCEPQPSRSRDQCVYHSTSWPVKSYLKELNCPAQTVYLTYSLTYRSSP